MSKHSTINEKEKECFYILTSDSKQINYEDSFYDEYLYEDTTKLSKIVANYINNKSDKPVLFLIFNAKRKETSEDDEHIDNFVVFKLTNTGKIISILTKCTPECENNNRVRIKGIQEDLNRLIKDTKPSEIFKPSNLNGSKFSIALNTIKNSVQEKDETGVFDSKIIKIALDNDISIKGTKLNTKSMLKKVLSSFQLIFNRFQKLSLDETQLKNLASTLISLTFKPEGTETRDLRLEVLECLLELKTNGHKLDDVNSIIEKYFDTNRNEFMEEMQKLELKLEKNVKAKGCMNMVLQKR